MLCYYAGFPFTFCAALTLDLQVAFWKFDHDGAVLYYDAWIPNLAAYNAVQTTPLTPQVEAGEIQQLCGAVQQECVGSNTQYNSTDDCVRTLSAKPFGDYDEVWGDNVVCRQIHSLLAAIDPVVSLQNATHVLFTLTI